MTPHEQWMRYALREAEKALDAAEVPVGCVIVRNNQVIGKGYNQNETLKDPTAHAEIIAITAAAAQIGSKILSDCTMYVTLEPCPMCAGAIVLARIPVLVFGAYDPKAGACGTLYNITEDTRLNHRVHTVGGVLDAECGALLKDFFKVRRLGGNGDSAGSGGGS
jgi:tRNA(adenine34) deaminase